MLYMCVIAGNEMPVLAWDNRLKIAIGAAKGLAYLHEDCKFILQLIIGSHVFIVEYINVFLKFT